MFFLGDADIRLELGLIFSRSGGYAALGTSALSGAMMAVEDMNRSGRCDIRVSFRDPGGDAASYELHTADLLGAGVRHIIGAITSWSRKDMIPVLERMGGLLWYPCPYEGFESNDHVVYLGAAPNHHLLPLVERVASKGMRTAYLVGSNYVWGWETLRLARDCLQARGLEILGERFVPLGSTAHAHVIDEVEESQPDVIVNSLIGPSNVSFISELARRCPERRRRTGHMVSCNQTEVDLDALGPAADGLLSAGAFFEEDAPETLCAQARQRDPAARISSFMATSYASVEIVVEAARRAGTDEPHAVFRAAAAAPIDTVLGPITIDPVMRHAALAPRLAVAKNGRFHVIERAAEPVPADPYLSGTPYAPAPARRPTLRVVQ